MRVGILSDTHDDLKWAKAGVQKLRDAGAELFIHCGDVGGERILDLFAGVPTVFVFGNTDFERELLKRYADDLGITCGGEFADLQLQGKRLAVTHGDDRKLMSRAVTEPFDYLLHGHTHVVRDERLQRKQLLDTSAGFSADLPIELRVINPGALHRALNKTVATLDLPSDELRIFSVQLR